ncbi:MAG: hypothetical protein J1E43_02650 [Christensenellaceae bacterium]|nr:hypothetical protein [Christensenellaceae bacterium]
MSNINQSSKPGSGSTGFLRRVLKVINHNGGFKILALLLSLLLWAGLITQDPSLTRERTFSDVNVSVAGSETLHRNGFIVTSNLEEVLGNVTLRVAVPQMQYQNAQAANYNTRIDLSRITEAGVQPVRISTSNSSYGTVLEVSPAEVEITVEEYVTRYRIPVRVQATGIAPEGFYASAPTASPSVITVSGPKSLVEPIICAEAVVELGSIPAREGTNRMAVPYRLVDINGNTIESDLLEITSESVLLDSIIIEQQLYTLKTIALSDTGLIRGGPADGYEIQSVSITPENITVAGSADVLAELDALYPENYVDLSGYSESFNRSLRLRDPGGLAYTSTSIITVAVEIGPVIQNSTYSNIRLSVQNIENGLSATLGTKYGSVVVSGPQLWIQKVRTSDVTLYCDAYGLSAGTYQLPVLCAINSSGETYSVDVTPATVEVTIVEK